jgi:murein DD-endopeptidase MepM/ murein hydrolase activator NlpD
MMDKDSLPKLELEGFASEVKQPEPDKRKHKTWASRKLGALLGENTDDVGKRGISIKIVDDKPKEADDGGYRRLMIKTGICAAIAVVILGIASINSPAANTITDTLGNAVEHELDIDKDIGRLKFVDNLNDETQSVFSPLPEGVAVLPSDGEILTAFGQSGSKGVRIDPVSTQIVSIAKGTIEYIGEIDGKGYIKEKLDTGETAYYYNVDPSVKVDDIVMPGQEIGNLSGDYLYVEIKNGDVYVDPMTYIEMWTAPAPE